MHSRERHSALGIASCCTFLSGVVIAAIIIASFLFWPGKMTTRGVPVDFTTPFIGVVVGAIFDLLALALGIAGLCQKGRKRHFAVLGTGLSLFPWVAIFALWLRG